MKDVAGAGNDPTPAGPVLAKPSGQLFFLKASSTCFLMFP
jgi:hypothetical protein